MKIKHIKIRELKTNLWSGGSTTELYIYPENSDYQKRNFDFRISRAKVESESSKFTSLPGISRELMILEGSIFISHINHHKKQLNKFDTDSFKGDWETFSKGNCTDFNLMCNNNNNGKIYAYKITKGKSLIIDINNNSKFYCIYVFIGELSFKTKKILKGEVIILSKIDNKSIEIIASKYSEVIITEVFL